MRVLVTGATGMVGRHVVDGLVKAGVSVRALSRHPDKARLPEAVEVVAGDLDDPGPLQPVFAGVDRMYLLAAGQTREVVELAKRAGVRRVVVLSSASVEFDPPTDSGAFHRAVERTVEDSGLEWTHVRPGMFTANLLDWAGDIRAEGVVRLPFNEALQAPVHERDVAAVAIAALTSDGHTSRAYTLTGPQALSKAGQFAQLGAGIGRPVGFEELTPSQWREQVAGRMPPYVIDFLLSLWAQIAQRPESVLPTVGEVLRRPALSVAEWAREHAADFQ